MSDPWLFGLAVAIVLGTPGPTNTLLLTAGATAGLRRSAPLLVAEVSGYAISVAIWLVAATAVSSAIPAVRAALSVVVGFYLLRLAFSLWRKNVEAGSGVVRWGHVFVTTLLNPKALVFAFGLIPYRLPNALTYYVALIAIVPVIGASWIALGALPRTRLGRLRTIVPRIGAVVVASFAVVLVVTSIQLA